MRLDGLMDMYGASGHLEACTLLLASPLQCWVDMRVVGILCRLLFHTLVIWVIIILFLVAWVFFGDYIKIAVMLFFAYYGCKFAYKLFRGSGH